VHACQMDPVYLIKQQLAWAYYLTLKKTTEEFLIYIEIQDGGLMARHLDPFIQFGSRNKFVEEIIVYRNYHKIKNCHFFGILLAF